MTDDPASEALEDPVEALADDPTIGPLVEEHGPLTLDPAGDLYERLVVSLVRQQVSMSAADAIESRLREAVELTPAAIADADDEALRAAGLSAAKVEYVTAAAEAFAERGYDRAYFAELTDAAVVDELTDIRGVGPWTAKMFLMFALGREDVFPVEDLGIRKGMAALVDAELTRGEMVDAAEAWRPYRSYAALYVWQHYEGGDSDAGRD